MSPPTAPERAAAVPENGRFARRSTPQSTQPTRPEGYNLDRRERESARRLRDSGGTDTKPRRALTSDRSRILLHFAS